MTRSVEAIQDDIRWANKRLHDSQESAQIVRLETELTELQDELALARALPTPEGET